MRLHRALLVLVLLTASLHAAPPDAGKKAKEAFAEGTSFFNLGQWDQAIEAWQRGYQLKSDAIFLYNIAQAYRLADNHEKAVFFYKSYLRNSPKAPNRDEVEDRIKQLEKLIEQKRSAREMPPVEALPAGGKPGSGTPPPPPETPPPPAPETTSPPPPQPITTEPTTVVAAPPRRIIRRIDLGVAGGANLWVAGIPGGAQPSTNITVTGGYTVFVGQRVELRVGLKLGYTYLKDITSTEHFISPLVDPMVRFRVWREKVFAWVDVGVGALILTGVSKGSVMVPLNATPSSTSAALEIRPALGVEYRIIPLLGVYLSPAIIYSPAPDKFTNSALLRVDVSLGASIRL